MRDLISRAFMKSLGAKCIAARDERTNELVAIIGIDELPSAQPERKRGRWITNNPNNPYESDYCKCSVCGYTNCTVEVLAFDGYNFCPNCGTDMRGDLE